MTLSEKGIVRPGQPVIRDGRYVVNFRGGGSQLSIVMSE